MPRVVIDVDSDVPAEQVFAAATNFSEQRPELSPNISREFWQLHNSGPNWADATEGSPSVWAREHYKWSDNRIVGTTQDSNVWEPGGTWTLTVHPHNGNGSHIHIDLRRRFKGKGLDLLPGHSPLRAAHVRAQLAKDTRRARPPRCMTLRR
jgi:hypothetical protein